VAAQIEFADGSCGQLIYSAEGDSSWPKELCTVFGPGFTAEIHNFQRLFIHRQRRRVAMNVTGKGHAEQMAAWAAFLRGEAARRSPCEQLQRWTPWTFAVLEATRAAHAVELQDA